MDFVLTSFLEKHLYFLEISRYLDNPYGVSLDIPICLIFPLLYIFLKPREYSQNYSNFLVVEHIVSSSKKICRTFRANVIDIDQYNLFLIFFKLLSIASPIFFHQNYYSQFLIQSHPRSSDFGS
ncbi:MAG: hypothetical protein CM15mP106_4390 [Candidatus Neomarinimicrobiota bacterium]|nr:MAG: hypothetical protein CM15mP106_4390 [Candidatus Neomarinimicrobiota bacterium]